MKNMIERLLEARAARREDREAGFSLIELIVVIAIIGILIAIAIPVYGNIQDRAKANQLKNAAATGASQVGAALADNKTVVFNGAPGPTEALVKPPKGVTLSMSGSTLSNFCVSAVAVAGGDLSGLTGADATATSGPGCS